MKSLAVCLLMIIGTLTPCASHRPGRLCGCLSVPACLLGLMLITGCVSTSTKTWNSRVGNYTVRQAVQDLGKPIEAHQLPDGSQVGSWMARAGTRGSMLYGMGSPYTLHTIDFQMWGDAPFREDEYLRLLFGPDGKLVTWDRQYK